MFETYRMLGREREAELESEAARLRPLAGRPINKIPVVIVAVIVAAFALGATVARAEVWPDGRAGAQLTTQASYPDLIERWVASHERELGQARPASTSHTGEAFDWRAALVGASTTAALALALGIGVGIARRSRIRSAAA